MSGQLDHVLRKIQDLNSQLERRESRNTKAWDDPKDYECHDRYRTCTRNDYENSCAYD